MVPPIFLALVLVLALVLLLQASFVLWPFGNDELSAIAVWQQLFTQPALLSSIAISLGTGLAASLLAFVVAIGLLALLFHRPGWNLRTNHRFYLLLALLLAVPHASVAIGFSLLFSAEGWLLRLVSPWLTGWHRPPDLAIVPDPWGLALIFGLFARELPFMVLIALAAQAGLRDEGRAFLMAQNCGYGRLAAFANAYGPRLYASMRPGCLIVVAYSVSVVDMALLLAPTRPEMLAVRVTSWQQEVQGFSHGAAGALLQIGVAILAMGIWEVGAKSAGYALRMRARWGQRRLRLAAPSVMIGKFLGFTALASMMICILMLGLWSIAGYWRFPAILPDSWTLQQFQQGGRLWVSFANALVVGLCTVIASMAGASLWLEGISRGLLHRSSLAIALLVLLIPQGSMMFGVSMMLALSGFDGRFAGVIMAHSLYGLAYGVLMLSGPWLSLDPRYICTARCFGKSEWFIFFKLRFFLLARPVALAAAVVFSVSLASWLPSLFSSNGRIELLVLDSVAAAASGDRRTAAAYGLMQTILPLIGFVLASRRWRA